MIAVIRARMGGDFTAFCARLRRTIWGGPKMRRFLAVLAIMLTAPAAAADYPAPQEGTWVARDFRFHTGEVMPELRLHYRTIGEPSGAPVLILHGTTGSGTGMLSPAFAGE